MTQPWENGKNPNFTPNLETSKFFSCMLPLLGVKQCSKRLSYAISRKTNEPNLKNDKKPNFGPDFGPCVPNLNPNFFFAGFTSTSN